VTWNTLSPGLKSPCVMRIYGHIPLKRCDYRPAARFHAYDALVAQGCESVDVITSPDCCCVQDGT